MLSLCLYVIVFSASGEMRQAFRGYKPSSVTALILEENKWNISMYVCVFECYMYVCIYVCTVICMYVSFSVSIEVCMYMNICTIGKKKCIYLCMYVCTTYTSIV